MKIDNEFTVSVPIERAWEVLTDLEGIAPCMPGARLTGVEGEVYSGKVRVKVGPVVSEYAGTVRFLEKDDAAYRAVIDAKGRDSRGAGNASAAITAHLRADGPRTVVSVDTDLKISGKVAQLGSGMIKEVSSKLLGQFVNCLEAKLTTEPAAPTPAQSTPATTPDSASAPAPAPTVTPAPASAPAPAAESTSVEPGTEAERAEAGERSDNEAPAPRVTTPEIEPEPLDILGVAGGAVYKRLIPLVVGIVVVIVAVAVIWAVVS
ncbi:SRPBCC family protein [Nonomuraea guangzhouensis]|uniref:SRPBCC family protein n=1 Tax=Nonomuraea guangzhouensis TaxID=1291555 RepID=A0ABW4G922_9ACTN|nr:SRPBCC family protein [Nonomuraea guangzhouensis]